MMHPAEGAEVRDDVLPQVRPVRVAVEAQRRDGDEKSVKRMRGEPDTKIELTVAARGK